MPEITKTAADETAPLPAFVWLILTAAVLFVYFLGLNIPFVGPDESRYAQVAREMLERGDWITPTLGGHTWFEKPALLYWFEIASYKLFGITEFAARLGPALCGIGTVVSVWLLGRSVQSISPVT
ncbi:MAG: phospholipid carrier-dependent glycosyltransferase, partial [Pyrinomonadaceae bacterium]